MRTAVGCTLFVMNMVFLLAGAGICYLGYFMLTDEELAEVYGSGLKQYAYWILGFGAFVVLTSFCGCAGSRTNKKRRARALLLTYTIVLLILLALQVAAGVMLWEKFGNGTLNAECVRKGATAGKVKSPIAGAEEIDCSGFAANPLRVTAYGIWQRLYADYELYSSDPAKYEGYKANAKLAASLTANAKCCGFGSPVDENDPNVPKPCVPNSKDATLLGRTYKYQVCANGATKSNPGSYCTWSVTAPASNGTPKLVKDCATKNTYDFAIGACSGSRPSGNGKSCYEYGCAEAIFTFFQRHVFVIVITLLILVLAEIFGVLAACCVLNPFVILALFIREICLGTHKLLRGFHKFTRCLCVKVCVCLPCSGGDGERDLDLEDGERSGRGGGGASDVTWCGWAADCCWCLCCCFICGMCMDKSDKDDKKKDKVARGRIVSPKEATKASKASKSREVANPLGVQSTGGTTL